MQTFEIDIRTHEDADPFTINAGSNLIDAVKFFELIVDNNPELVSGGGFVRMRRSAVGGSGEIVLVKRGAGGDW